MLFSGAVEYLMAGSSVVPRNAPARWASRGARKPQTTQSHSPSAMNVLERIGVPILCARVPDVKRREILVRRERVAVAAVDIRGGRPLRCRRMRPRSASVLALIAGVALAGTSLIARSNSAAASGQESSTAGDSVRGKA